MRRRGIVLAVAVAGTLAACSSSDAADPAPTAVAPTTIATTTSAPPTTAAPTSSEAPTTTLDPEAALAAEVEADLLEAMSLGRRAQMDPFDPAAEDAALSLRLGFAKATLEAQLAEWREKRYAIRENSDTPAEVSVTVPAQLVSPSADLAEVQVCEIDSWILVERDAGPNGTESVVNSDTVTYATKFYLRLSDGRWRVEGADELARWDGAGSCDERA